MSTDTTTGLWWRHRWMEAVYASDLKPLERFVASIYADHARDQRTAWVTTDRLVERTGLSRTQAKMWRSRLIASGFLVEVQKAKHHAAAIYGLVVPDSQRVGEPTVSEGRTPDPLDTGRGSDVRPQGVGYPSVGGRMPDPNQSPYPSSSTISLSRDQELVADLLGLEPRDERLMNVQKMLDDNHVRSPRAWIRAVARDQTLLGLLEASKPSRGGWWNDQAHGDDADFWEKQHANRNTCQQCSRRTWDHADDCAFGCPACHHDLDAHDPGCTEREILLCAGDCGQEVTIGQIVMGRPCKVCGHVNTRAEHGMTEPQPDPDEQCHSCGGRVLWSEQGPRCTVCSQLQLTDTKEAS